MSDAYSTYEYEEERKRANAADRKVERLEKRIKKMKALLKAGEKLRDSLIITEHQKRDGSSLYREANIIDNMLAVQAIEAWDTANKAKDV